MKTRLPTFRPLAFLALLHPLLALAQQTPQTPPPAPAPPYYAPYWWHGPGHMWGGGWGYGWGGPLMMLGWIAIGVIIVLLVRRSGDSWHRHHRSDPSHSALQILNERYARGEIQKPEYEEKKAAILAGNR